MIAGRIYLERGEPVTVLVQWGPGTRQTPPAANGPRNVPIERDDGTRTIRPFRGLRKPGGAA